MCSFVPVGAEIASGVPITSGIRTEQLIVPTTLEDLLRRLSEYPPKEYAMLKTVSSLLSTYLNDSPSEISIERITDSRKGFRNFLLTRKYAKNSIRTYVNHTRILLDLAASLGWKVSEFLSDNWKDIFLLAQDRKCADIVKDLSRVRDWPNEILEGDVLLWADQKILDGRSYGWTRVMTKRFWRVLRDSGATEQLPLCLKRDKNYAAAFKDLPPALHAEISALLKWKQAAYALDRPKHARNRPISANNLRQVLCQLYGFATGVAMFGEIASLSALIQKQLVGAFVEWCINERQVMGRSLHVNLGTVFGALRYYPSFAQNDLSWFKPLLDSIPIETEAELKKRKAAKFLEYIAVESIPGQIHAERSAAAKKSQRELAVVVRNELLMKWIITLPWRQRNIRECRVGGASPNLFRGKIPPFSTIDLPQWVKDELVQNPDAEFWQFRFSTEETKTGISVEALLPKQLVPLLEEYLGDHRQALLRGADPTTLLLTRKGKPISMPLMTALVSDLTLRYQSRRINPHAFRDIVAYTWLKTHPRDFLTLSKMLWHSNVNTTIKIYGARFNESSGVCAMEDWLAERAANASAGGARKGAK